MYGVEPIFWRNLFLILVIFGVSLFLFNIVMRRLLKVKKKKFFSYNHLNDKHKKIDWTIRITFIVLMIIGFTINMMRDLMERIWFLEPPFLLFILIVVSEAARAIMEWKYASNRNDYIFTISQLVCVISLLLIMISTNFFGLVG